MADVNSQIALGINAPDPNQGLNTISKILGIGQQGLAIRGQQSENVTRAAQATEAAQNAKEKMAGAQLLSDPVGSGLVDSSGNPTPNAQKIIYQAMPTIGSKHYEGLMNGAKSKVQFNSAVNDLRTSERAELAQGAAGIAAAAQSPEDITSWLDQTVESKKGTPEEANYRTIAGTMKQAITHLAETSKGNNPSAPGQEPWRLGVLNMGRGMLPATATVGAGGTAAPQAATVDTGPTIQPGATAPPLQGGGFTPSGTPIQKGVPPGAIIVKDTNNNQFVLDPKNNRIAPLGAGGGAGAPSRTVPPKFVQPIAGQETAQKEVEATRAADQDYGTNRHINNTILRLSADTKTGPGTDVWHHALGAISGPLGGNNVADYQTIGAFLDRQAALSTRQMGLPETNAGISTAQSLSGTTGYQPEALQTKVKLTDALVEGAHKYRVGLDKVIGTGPNQDLSKYQAYRSAWAANFDPNVFALDAAMQRGDRAEVAKIASTMTPAQAAVARQKAANLRMLEKGEIP